MTGYRAAALYHEPGSIAEHFRGVGSGGLLREATERVREYMEQYADDGPWTYEGIARAALAHDRPAGNECRCPCYGCRAANHDIRGLTR